MKRIKQLLAKGIENLDDNELAELTTLLAAEALGELSDTELADVKVAVGEAADEIIADEDDTSEASIDALGKLAEAIDVIEAEETRRNDIKADAAARKAALRDRIKGEPPVDEPEASDDDSDDDSDESAEDEIVVEAVEELPVAASTDGNVSYAPTTTTVTAATAGTTVVTRVAARRPDAVKPRVRPDARQAPLTVAAGLPGMNPGQRLANDQQIFMAWDSAVQLARGADPQSDLGVKFKMPVLSLRSEIPDDLMLDRDPERNAQIIEGRVGLAALTAAGGACAPVPYRYDLPTVGDDIRPVRDALARFGAQRAGVSVFTPPTIDDVDGTGATTSAVSEWTYANDENPSSPTTKPYLRIDCGSNSPTVTRVNAIVQQFETGNMLDRWYPELIQAYMRLIAVYGARFAEAKLLATIATGSKTVTHGELLGSASDIFPSLDQLIMGIKYRHRIASSLPMRVIGFDWVKRSIITDLIRRGNGDRPLEERLAMAEGAIASWFAARNCNVTWSPDFQFGRTLGTAGGPVAGVQNPGPVIGYPGTARFYVFIEGSWLFLDGGELRLGVYRDSTLIRRNDFAFFSETFENAAYHGVPGESYVYDMNICANGGYSSALDIDPCVSNS